MDTPKSVEQLCVERLERTGERNKRLQRFTAIRRLPALEGVTSTRAQLFAGPGIFYPLVGNHDVKISSTAGSHSSSRTKASSASAPITAWLVRGPRASMTSVSS